MYANPVSAGGDALVIVAFIAVFILAVVWKDKR